MTSLPQHPARRTLSPRARLALLPLSLAFGAIFVLVDLREGGPRSSLTTWYIKSPAHFARLFGAPYAVGALCLDAILAVATAWCLMLGFEAWRRRRQGVGAACAPGAAVIWGVALFGCPGCVVPLAGTLGISAFAIDLPLYGLEFQIVAIVLVLATALWWRRRLVRLNGDAVRFRRMDRRGWPGRSEGAGL